MVRRWSVVVGVAAVLALLGPGLLAQQPTFKSGVEIVLIDVTVVNRTGQPVGDLKPEDFQVTVDRKPRRIASADFTRYNTRSSTTRERAPATTVAQPAAPTAARPPAPARNLLIVVDVDSMEPGDGLLLRKVSAGFFDQLAPDDRVAVVTVPRLKSEIELTKKKSDARKALESVITSNERFRSRWSIGVSEAFAVQRGDRSVMARIIARNCQGGDKLCPSEVEDDTRQLALQEQLRSQRTLDALRDLGLALRQVAGPKTVVLLTGGMTPPDVHQAYVYSQVESAFASAQVTLYTLYLEQPQQGQVKYALSPSWGEDTALEREGVENATSVTGGTFMEMIGTLEPYFDRVATELSGSYLIGVEVAAADRDGRPHHVDVKVNRRDLEVRARKQYVIEPARPRETAARAGRETEPPVPARAVMWVTTPEVEAVVARASDYVAGYETELSGLVSEERYVQRQYRLEQKDSPPTSRVNRDQRDTALDWVPDGQRELRSDYLLVKAPTLTRWVPFRDVFEVDGRKVRDREARLQKLFLEEPSTATQRATEIANESARYNIGFVERNVNVPTFALMFVDPASRERFTFSKLRESTVNGVRLWEIAYREWQSPTIVRDKDRDLPAEGVFWIDPVQGRIVKSTMRLQLDEATTEEVTVAYTRTARTGDTWVPAEMRELYTGKTRKLECVATYSNIRRFQVSTDVQIPK